MSQFKFVSDPRADLDIEAVFQWYEDEQAGLGIEFLDELRAAYARILDGPFQYEQLRSNIRRALLKRFPLRSFLLGGRRGDCRTRRTSYGPQSSRVATPWSAKLKSRACEYHEIASLGTRSLHSSDHYVKLF